MRLQYLTANAAYVFTFGDSIIKMGDSPRFHDSRKSAIAAAAACGLTVARDGSVSVA